MLSFVPKPPVLEDIPGTDSNNAATLSPGRNNQNTPTSCDAARALRPPQPNDTGAIVDGRQYIGESHWDVVLRDVCYQARPTFDQHL